MVLLQSTAMSDRPRPSCCRNLTAEFDAVAGIEAEPPEVSENRENLFVEQFLNDKTEAFKARWGYDVREDRPVEGSDWEWEPIEPRIPAVEVEAPVQGAQADVAVEQEVAVEPGAEGAAQEPEGGERGDNAYVVGWGGDTSTEYLRRF